MKTQSETFSSFDYIEIINEIMGALKVKVYRYNYIITLIRRV